jgi:hypothetical protein
MAKSSRRLWDEWGHASWHGPFEALVATSAIARILFAWFSYFWLILISSPISAETQLHVSTWHTLIYGLAGSFLFFRSREDPRARALGMVFLLIANAYVNYPLGSFYAATTPKFDGVMAVALGVCVETFLAFFFWVFVERFPSPTISLSLRRIIVLGRQMSLMLGGAILLVIIFRIYRRLTDLAISETTDQLTAAIFNQRWDVLYPLLIVALPAIFLKFRQLKGEERRRAGLFFYSCALFWALPSIMLMAFDILPTLLLQESPETPYAHRFRDFLRLIFPFATTYAVLADRVLDVRSIARSGLTHKLTKYSVVLLGLVPFLFLFYFGWVNRDATLTEFLSGSNAMVLLTVAALGAVILIYRRQLLDLVDRRFFRERYDSRRVLADLIDQVRSTRGLVELASLLERRVDLALHLERVSLLVERSGAGRYLDPLGRLPPLDPGSQLLTVVAGSREPISVDLETPRSSFRSLPVEDKTWLAENGIEMLAAICSLDGHLTGLLALGRKRSELPFLREDRDLLAAVASSVGLMIELMQLREKAAGAPSASFAAPAEDAVEAAAATDELATTCIACDRLYPPGSAECPQCGVGLERTNVPYILRDLYRLDSRLGSGGMAVVYRAKDLKLGRPVAVKTLPRVNAEAAMRLRREARTAASVSHPGLAAIYGLETWRGVPMIITELLAGGTLADQLGREPLEAIDAIDMARTIALALAKIHGIGILHRDVKPSNIGYTEDGHVKLLDFGIARIEHDFRREHPDGGQTSGAHRIFGSTTSVMLPRTKTGQLVGTVTYLSPEAARGEKPDPGVDLWALSVCIHESLTAENLFYGRNFDEVLDKIRGFEVPDVRKKARTCPEPLARFLAAELSLDRSRRAEDGLEMASRLAEVRARILGA